MNQGFFSSKVLRKSRLPACSRCGLSRRCLSPRMEVFRGKGRRILVVGEAPGAEEDKAGRPFVGKAGQYLRDVLDDLGVDLDECEVTNAIACRPPKNVMDSRYLGYCQPLLQKTLEESSARVILVLGQAALQQVLFESYQRFGGGITKWRGWTIPSRELGAWVCPSFHPSYIQRESDEVLDVLFREDLAKAVALEASTVDMYSSLEELEAMVEIVIDPGERDRRLVDLARRTGTLAFDFETTGLKPEYPNQRIVSCAFSLDGRGAWASRLDDDKSYALLGRVLFARGLGKVASNLKFEERWTRATWGRGVSNWVWDTMLAAHCLDSRQAISSIKFQAFVRLGSGVWDDEVSPYLVAEGKGKRNRIEQAPVREMLLYNGLDALLTYRVMVEQKREMEEGLRADLS